MAEADMIWARLEAFLTFLMTALFIVFLAGK